MDARKSQDGSLAALAAAVFAPRAVALVGASGDTAKNTARPQRYLLKHGYTGRIVPINATRPTVLDLPAFKSLVEAKSKIDHAFIMVEDVEGALEDCGRAGVPVASVFSDGFADAGEKGVARQKKLAARAQELGVRLLGPNSMGMINLSGRCALTVNAVLEMDAPPEGPTSIVSQSGTMLGTVLSRGAARGLGFSKLVSVGNEADLGVGELVEMLAADPETKTILLFLETVRNADSLAKGARAAHAAGKPVIAYKLGRSKLGARLARSHTGALAGEDAALDAYFRDCGIARVDMLETLIEAGPLFAGRQPPDLARPPRVSVVTTTGGGAASVVDRLGTQGIDVASPDPHAPIMDLTMGRKSATYGAVVEQLLAFEGSDAVLAVVGSSAQFHPQLAVEPILKAKRGAKPLAVFMTPHAEKSMALLAQAGIAAFRTPEACADAFNAYFSWKTPRAPAISGTVSFKFEGKPTEESALRLFASLGVPVVEAAVAAAPDYAHSIPYPVAVKLLSAEVAHKSDIGGVALGVGDLQELRQNVLEIGAATGQPVDRVLVQRMEPGLGEAIVGYRDDAVVGPLVMVGAGGILAELYNDVVLRRAPVDEAGAAEMVAAVKGFAALRGYRGKPPGDLKALAQAVAAMSRLALVAGRPVQEAEANPVIVKASGAVAVDALVVLKN